MDLRGWSADDGGSPSCIVLEISNLDNRINSLDKRVGCPNPGDPVSQSLCPSLGGSFSFPIAFLVIRSLRKHAKISEAHLSIYLFHLVALLPRSPRFILAAAGRARGRGTDGSVDLQATGTNGVATLP